MKHTKLTIALALSLTSSLMGSASYARESISDVSARVATIETQVAGGVPILTTALSECGNKFTRGGQISNELPIVNPVTGETYFSVPIPSPSTGGIFADSEALSSWDYGFMGTQLYTNESGELSCGVVVDMQALVESILDIGMGAACITTAVGATSKDPSWEAADEACGIIDNAVRVSNALFWLGVSGADRRVELATDGSPAATEGPVANLYKKPTETDPELNLLTLGIPEGPAELVAQIKARAIDNPLEALSQGNILIGDIEIALTDLIPPYEIVLAELQTNGQVLLESPAQFVADTAAVVAEHYVNEVITPELILAIIEAASKIEFVDEDGNQVFEMALGNDGFGPGLNQMDFKLDGNNVLTLAPRRVGIEVASTLLDIGEDELSLRINGNTIISASETDVCFPGGVCIGALNSLVEALPTDLSELGDLTGLGSDVENLKSLVPVDLPTKLNVLDTDLATLQGLVPTDLSGQLSSLNTNLGNLSGTVSGHTTSISQHLGWINTMWGALYNAGGPGQKAEGLWNQVNGSGGLATQLSSATSRLNGIDTTLGNHLGWINTMWVSLYYAGGVGEKANNLHTLMYSPSSSWADFTHNGVLYRGLKGKIDWTYFYQLSLSSSVETLKSRVNSIITTVPSVSSLPLISDERLKTNIAPLTSSLEKIVQLQGVTHQWNEQAEALGVADLDRTVLGFIAQDVQAVLPEVVYEGIDGYFRVDYAKILPLVVESIKDQETRMLALQAENAQLKTYLCGLDSTAPFCGD